MSSKLIASLCPYCAVGCGLFIRVDKGRATGIEYMTDHPTSAGALCPKGNSVLELLDNQERLKHPMKRSGSDFVPISWDEALDLVAQGLSRNLDRYGPESLGFLASSRTNNEENYLMQKMARLLGSPNVDNCARLCHSPTVMGLGATFGAGAMTNNLLDLENSKCIFAIGTNFTEAHPVVSRWVQRAKDNGAVLIVADPRITSTTWMADIHLRLKPGSDIDLLRAMMKVIVDEKLEDADFIGSRTTGYEKLKEGLSDFSMKEAAEKTGLSIEQITKAARTYAKSSCSALLYSMGITQHVSGTDNVMTCATLALLCGQIARPGAGVWPMRGQNNVQGNCDVGGMPEFYPGYKRSVDPKTVEFFKAAWNATELPLGPGLTSTEMNDAAIEGRLKALYITGEDPIVCDANVRKTRRALESLDFLVVQEIFMTPTAKMADVVLPAAAWAEKSGSYTSMERRVQWIDRAIEPPGEAKEGIWIICEIARRLGLGEQMAYDNASQVLEEIRRLVPQYGGMSKERISRVGGVLWPCPDELHPGTDILHTQRFSTADGRARIFDLKNTLPGEVTSSEYPFLLSTGRIVLQYNGGSMTMRSQSLKEREPELYVQINPLDATKLLIAEGDRVAVITRRGEAEAHARITDGVMPGMAFMPFHYHGTNLLTSDALDPVSRIPEYKMAACRIESRA